MFETRPFAWIAGGAIALGSAAAFASLVPPTEGKSADSPPVEILSQGDDATAVERGPEQATDESPSPVSSSRVDAAAPASAPLVNPFPSRAAPADDGLSLVAVGAPRSIPPSLLPQALLHELERSGARRKEEEVQLAQERARLEQLRRDVEEAQRKLLEETARLEELLAEARAAASQASTPAAPAAAEAPTPIAREDEATTRRLENLSKSLRGMKPQQAAELVRALDRSLAAKLLAAMRPADAGAILGQIAPAQASALVEEIARLPAKEKRR